MQRLKFMLYSAMALLPIFAAHTFQWQSCIPREKCYGNCTLGKLEMNGLLELRGTRVAKGLCLHGTLDAEDADLSSAYIVGRAVIKNSCIGGDAYVIGTGILRCTVVKGIMQMGGPLEAYESQFFDVIQAASGLIELEGCRAPSIYVFPCKDEIQVVKLRCGTQIEGDIAFEAENGRVIIDCTSTLKGQVIGGQILCD